MSTTAYLDQDVPPVERRGWWARLGAVVLVLFKVKGIGTLVSAVVAIGAYTLIWGVPFAVGFVLLLFVHEMGHVIQLRREGIRASAPMFIPFLGAVVMMKEMPPSAVAEARVGLAGPVLGTLAALALWPAGLALDSDLLLALCFVGLFLNLFNLLPVLPLDGGRAMAAVNPKLWFIGLAALLLFGVLTASPLVLLIALLGGLEMWGRRAEEKRAQRDDEERTLLREQAQRLREQGLLGEDEAREALEELDRAKAARPPSYRDVPPRQRVAVLAVYLGVAAACAAGMAFTYIPH